MQQNLVNLSLPTRSQYSEEPLLIVITLLLSIVPFKLLLYLRVISEQVWMQNNHLRRSVSLMCLVWLLDGMALLENDAFLLWNSHRGCLFRFSFSFLFEFLLFASWRPGTLAGLYSYGDRACENFNYTVFGTPSSKAKKCFGFVYLKGEWNSFGFLTVSVQSEIARMRALAFQSTFKLRYRISWKWIWKLVRIRFPMKFVLSVLHNS